MEAASIGQLRRWAADPRARREFSPLAERRFLLVDAGDADDPVVAGWLRHLPCPAIGIGTGPLSRACDTAVERPADAATLVRNIERNPIAAGVLCELLRATADLPLPAALAAESLAYATLQGGGEFRRWLAGHRAATVPPDPGPPVILERRDDTLTLTLNRPSNRNAMSIEVRDALIEALELVLCDRSIARAVLAGAGRAFCVGGDLAEFGTVPDPATGHAVRSLALPARLLAQCADRVEVRLHGACIGAGIELPSFAARITAAPDTFVQLPELRFGLIPGAGGCVGIARRIGRQRTAWLALSGARVPAARALAWGLVDALDGEEGERRSSRPTRDGRRPG